MKLYRYKYNDMSDPDVPNRDIKWEFWIPYILKVNGSLFSGYSIHIWFLCFGIDWITDCGCGKVNKIRFWKYYISFILRRGWSFEFHIGIERYRVSDWKFKRQLKKMTPEKAEETIKEIIKGLNYVTKQDT